MTAALLAGMLAACSGVPYAQRVQQRQAAYAAAAGAPVRSFRFFSLYSWEPITDTQLAVYTRPNQAYLLNVQGACTNLSYANAIGLTSSLNEVTVRFDKVLAGRGFPPCIIEQIRPVDLGKLKVEHEEQRKIQAQARAAETSAPAGS